MVYTYCVYMFVKADLKNWGNSYGIRISKKLADELQMKKGDTMILEVKRKIRQVEGFGMFKGAKPFVRDSDDELRDW